MLTWTLFRQGQEVSRHQGPRKRWVESKIRQKLHQIKFGKDICNMLHIPVWNLFKDKCHKMRMSERRWCICSDILVVFGENCQVVHISPDWIWSPWICWWNLHRVSSVVLTAHGTVGAAAVPPPGNAFVGPSPSPRYGGHSDPDLISGLWEDFHRNVFIFLPQKSDTFPTSRTKMKK